MAHQQSPKVSLSVWIWSVIICILIAVVSFYSYKKSCSTKQATTAAINDTGNHYITVAGPNGDAVKVSSKLSGLAQYIADDKSDSTENGDTGNQGFWKTKFKDWREKMVSNDITPSLTNFMDIVELSKIVKEN